VQVAQGKITRIILPNQVPSIHPRGEESELHLEAFHQLREYFAGHRKDFVLPLELIGTPFQTSVWKQLQRIPYGEVSSYASIAQAIGNPKGVRAVGGANARNPIPIVVPCHRVIGKDNSMVGYGGGLRLKEQLLTLEGVLEQCLNLST